MSTATSTGWLKPADIARDLGRSPRHFGREQLRRLGVPFVDLGGNREAHAVRISEAAYRRWKDHGGV